MVFISVPFNASRMPKNLLFIHTVGIFKLVIVLLIIDLVTYGGYEALRDSFLGFSSESFTVLWTAYFT
jgi:hypothetical protein